MTNRKQIKTSARQFYRSLQCDLSLPSLQAAAQAKKWSVHFYDGSGSDEDELIEHIHLTEYAQSVNAFCYHSDNYQFIFIRRQPSEERTRLLFLHELGHIVLEHLPQQCVFNDTNLQQEKEANQFVHDILKLSKHKKNYVKTVLLLLLAAIVIFLCLQFRTQNTVCYLTNSGRRYHTAECYYIRGETNITKTTVKAAQEHGYTPCHVCLGKTKPE